MMILPSPALCVPVTTMFCIPTPLPVDAFGFVQRRMTLSYPIKADKSTGACAAMELLAGVNDVTSAQVSPPSVEYEIVLVFSSVVTEPTERAFSARLNAVRFRVSIAGDCTYPFALLIIRYFLAVSTPSYVQPSGTTAGFVAALFSNSTDSPEPPALNVSSDAI